MRYLVSFLLLAACVGLAKSAPPFRGETLSGKRITLQESLKENRYLLLSFWATWCTGCIEELKHVSAKLETSPELALDLLTVNVDLPETAADVKPTMRLYGFSFPVVADPKHEIFSKYQLDKSLPFSMLISPQGEIIQAFQGYSESLFTQVETLTRKKS